VKHERLDGYLFAQMIQAGAINLTKHVAKVDALNVFPVKSID